MSENLIELYDKILVDQQSFDRIKNYVQSRGAQPPVAKELNIEDFERIDAVTKSNQKLIDDEEFDQGASNYDANKQKFLELESKIFLTANNPPAIYSKFIFSYYVYQDQSKKAAALNFIKKYLETNKKVYEILADLEMRYFDENFNVVYSNIPYGQVEKIRDRIKEVQQLDTTSRLTQQQTEVWAILNKHGLL